MNHARNARRLGKLVASLPVIIGLLLGTYFTFVPHLESDPDTPVMLVTTSGIDCVLGNHVATSCLALRRGLALLVVSGAIAYFVHQEATAYLLAVVALFSTTGIVFLQFDGPNIVYFGSAALFAVGALLMRPEMVTERARDGLDGRFTGR